MDAAPDRQLVRSIVLLRWLPLALLTLTVFALFYRLLTGEILFWGLPSLQFYPWREFAMRELAQGRLPLWNPFNGAGTPLLANYQSALLYPPHLLYFLWSAPQMMGLLGILHILWAGVGMWLLTGRLRLPSLGRGIAALSYPLSSTIIARFGTLPMVDAAAWLPWLILGVELLIEQLSWRRFLLLVGIITMQLLAGHAQWTFYSFVLAGGYSLWRIVAQRQPARVLIVIATAIIFGAAIAAIQLLPTAELQRQSQRADSVGETYALNFSFAPISLLTLFNPDLFGNPGNGTYAINGAYFETTAYIGFLPLILALTVTIRYVLTRRRQGAWRSNLIPFFALTAIISLILATGRYGFIYPLLYRYVPTFNLFQAPARWLILTVFSLSMVAAFAVPAWEPDRRIQRRLRAGVVILVIVTAMLIVLSLGGRNQPSVTIQLFQGLIGIGVLGAITAAIFAVQPGKSASQAQRIAWMVAVLAFVAVDLYSANRLSNPTVSAHFYATAETPTIMARSYSTDQYAQDVFNHFLPFNDYPFTVGVQNDYRHSNIPNLNLLDRRPSLNNFEPLRVSGIEQFTRLLDSSAETQRSALLQAAGVSILNDVPRSSVALPRVWIVPVMVDVSNIEEAAQKMSDANWNPYQTAFVENYGANGGPIEATGAGTATIDHETPLDITMKVDSPGGGLLVLADTYYPGWQAMVDGVPTSIYRVNMAFRGVVVTAGQHTVQMTYQPRSFLTGALISAAALALYGVLSVVALVRRTRIPSASYS